MRIRSIALIMVLVVAGCGGAADSSHTATVPPSTGASATSAAATPTGEPASPSPTTPPATGTASAAPTEHAGTFALTSPAFADGAAIPARFTCDGKDQSPPLAWTGLPAGTNALLLTMRDPDAGDFLHWIAWNIPASTDHLGAGASGALPGGSGEGHSDFSGGARGYRGPCPPSGTHRYVFTLFALPIQLADARTTEAAKLEKVARRLGLGETTLTGTYRRP